MTVFWAASKRDSVSLLSFPIRSHFSSLPIWDFVILSILSIFLPFLFPSYRFTTSVYIVTAVTNCCNKYFFAYFNVVFGLCFHASMLSSILVSSLFTSFLHTYTLSLCHFLKNSSLVHLKNVTEYLMKGIDQISIRLMRCMLYSLVSSCFFVFLWFFLNLFFHCLMVSASNIPKYL